MIMTKTQYNSILDIIDRQLQQDGLSDEQILDFYNDCYEMVSSKEEYIQAMLRFINVGLHEVKL